MNRLTREQVTDTLGSTDDLRVAEIIGTGASLAEVLEAKRWLTGDKRTLGSDDTLRAAIVDELCDILSAEEAEWETGER